MTEMKSFRKYGVLVLAALWVIAASPEAVASSTATAKLSITATISATCTISTEAVTIGSQDALELDAATVLEHPELIATHCNSVSMPVITLSQPAPDAGSDTARDNNDAVVMTVAF